MHQIAEIGPQPHARPCAEDREDASSADGPEAGALPRERADEAVMLEQARLLHFNAQGMAIATAINGLLLVLAYIGSALPPATVLGWYVLLVIALLHRFRVMARFRRIDTGPDAQGWLRAFTVASGVMGCVWGVAALAIVFVPDPLRAALVVFVLASMTAGAAATSGVYARAAIAFVIPALLPMFGHLIHRGLMPGASHVDWAMAVLMAVYFVLLVRVARATEYSITTIARLKAEKSGLAERLAASVSELEENERALRRTGAELQIIADYTYAWELWFSNEGTLLWLNPAVERITGYTREEAFGFERFPLDVVHADDRDAVTRFLKDATTVPGLTAQEFRILRKDGEMRWCAAESTPAKDSSGGSQGFRVSIRDITDRRTLQNELERLASTDPLTGAVNRRKFYELFDREVYRAARYDRPTVLASFDIDHFKIVNDAYGHAVGDLCLRTFVETIDRNTRQSDVLARFGGEEFVLLMPETDAQAAIELCERLKRTVSAIEVPSEEGPVTFTVSVGLTEIDPIVPNLDFALGVADAALYQSKRNGRNRVTYMMSDQVQRSLKN